MISGTAAFSFGVVCEAQGDQRIASGLAERVIVDEINWIDRENIGGFLTWRGIVESTKLLD